MHVRRHINQSNVVATMYRSPQAGSSKNLGLLPPIEGTADEHNDEDYDNPNTSARNTYNLPSR